MPTDSRLTISDLASRWRVSNTTIWRMRKDPNFPKAVGSMARPTFIPEEIAEYELKTRPAAVPSDSTTKTPKGQE